MVGVERGDLMAVVSVLPGHILVFGQCHRFRKLQRPYLLTFRVGVRNGC